MTLKMGGAMVRRLSLVMIAAIWAVSCPAARVSYPAAVLLSFEGDVKVVRRTGDEVPASFGLALKAGEQVKTGASSRADVFFRDGSWIQVGPGSTIRIREKKGGASASEAKVVEQPFQMVQNLIRLKDSEGTSSLARLRSVPGQGEIKLLYPCHTKVLESKLSFRWEGPDREEELKLTVYGQNGVVWEKKVRGEHSVAYPSSAPTLSPGYVYSWTLETTDPLRTPPLRTKAAFFEILPPAEGGEIERALSKLGEKVDRQSPSFHMVLAGVFNHYGLIGDAIEEVELAVGADPDNPTLHAILAHLYAQAGRSEEAIAEYDKLLQQHR